MFCFCMFSVMFWLLLFLPLAEATGDSNNNTFLLRMYADHLRKEVEHLTEVKGDGYMGKDSIALRYLGLGSPL